MFYLPPALLGDQSSTTALGDSCAPQNPVPLNKGFPRNHLHWGFWSGSSSGGADPVPSCVTEKAQCSQPWLQGLWSCAFPLLLCSSWVSVPAGAQHSWSCFIQEQSPSLGSLSSLPASWHCWRTPTITACRIIFEKAFSLSVLCLLEVFKARKMARMNGSPCRGF